MPTQNETVQRRRLAQELRRLREAADLTIDQVAEALECSRSKISRIENAQVKAAPRDVRDMLSIYRVSGQKQDDLVQLAREARQESWWRLFSDLPITYAAFEAEAASICMFAALVLPGLFQTRDYARAVFRALKVELQPAEIEHRVDFRMARQSVLNQAQPPNLLVLIDEAALRRPVGGRGVMDEQLRHLIECAQLPNVSLRIIPFEAGEHAGMDGGFSILIFPDPADPDTVYLENPLDDDQYTDETEKVRQYHLTFGHLRDVALSPESSLEFLVNLAKEL
jgi:transcriptional regulator with XRE-family HTH domain